MNREEAVAGPASSRIPNLRRGCDSDGGTLRREQVDWVGMVCGSCNAANRDGARFCASCGLRLGARCAVCDVELADDARFCDACGAPVADASPEPVRHDQARKTVTVVFADLAGSTSMQERMDPEAVRAFTTRYYAVLRDASVSSRPQSSVTASNSFFWPAATALSGSSAQSGT